MYSMVVTAVKEEDAELGKKKSCMQYYFENPVDAAKCYLDLMQDLTSQSEAACVNIRATLDEEV